MTNRNILSLTLLFLLLLAWPSPGQAQDPAPPPAAPPDAAVGLDIFAERCANCHGPQGMGDGELAAELPNPPAALGAPGYMSAAVPVELFETIKNGRIERGMPPFGPASTNPLSDAQIWDAVAALYSLGTPAETVQTGAAVYEAACADCHGPAGGETTPNLADPAYWASRGDDAVVALLPAPDEHDFDLSTEEQTAVVSYARSLSYGYLDPALANAPLETAVIDGVVVNGSSGEAVGEGQAVLRVFDDASMVEVLTTTVSAGGEFQFDLVDVPLNQVYLVQVDYNDLSFNSDIGRLSRSQPALNLPITVYETTTDATMVSLDRLHIILEFVDDRLRVNEFYQFSNVGTAVYVGPSGDPEEGTVVVDLPEGAVNPIFRRSFGGLQDLLPADDVVPADGGWTDPTPLYPGFGALALLVRYEMPYESGMTVAHPVRYPVGEINLVVPEAGVELTDAGGWQDGGQQQMGEGGSFLTFVQAGLPAGETVTWGLTGQPRLVETAAAASASLLIRDQQTELIVGGAALLLVMVAAVYFVNDWVNNMAADDDPDALLQAIADLDDAYARGDIARSAYERQRAELKEHLVAIWQ